MENFKKNKLVKSDLSKVVGGGRIVRKVDIDGDGRWDVKYIRRRNGTQVIIFR